MKKIILLLLFAVSMSFALKVVGVETRHEHEEKGYRMYGPIYFRLDNSDGPEIKGFRIYYYVSTIMRKAEYSYNIGFFLHHAAGMLGSGAKLDWEIMPESPNWIRVIFDYPTRSIPAGGEHPDEGIYHMLEFGDRDHRMHAKYHGLIKRKYYEYELQNVVVESADGKILYGEHPKVNRRVGILTSSAGCYSGLVLDVTLDTEDSNCNTRFIEKKHPIGITISSKGNVTFEYCAVEYDELPRATFDYVVLRLDHECPRNSYPFRRVHDTEDKNNANSFWSSIPRAWPNDVRRGYNVSLEYCFVPADPNSKIIFPFREQFPIGRGFGVYAVASLPETTNYQLYIDDEDGNNQNAWEWYDTPKSIQNRIKKIMYGSNNTTYNVFTYDPPMYRKIQADAEEEAKEMPASKVASVAFKGVDRSVVNVELESAGDVEISFVKPTGGVAARFTKENLGPGAHSLSWNSANVPNGRYIAVIKQNGLMNATNVILK